MTTNHPFVEGQEALHKPSGEIIVVKAVHEDGEKATVMVERASSDGLTVHFTTSAPRVVPLSDLEPVE